jgi:hypothetical protein
MKNLKKKKTLLKKKKIRLIGFKLIEISNPSFYIYII